MTSVKNQVIRGVKFDCNHASRPNENQSSQLAVVSKGYKHGMNLNHEPSYDTKCPPGISHPPPALAAYPFNHSSHSAQTASIKCGREQEQRQNIISLVQNQNLTGLSFERVDVSEGFTTQGASAVSRLLLDSNSKGHDNQEFPTVRQDRPLSYNLLTHQIDVENGQSHIHKPMGFTSFATSSDSMRPSNLTYSGPALPMPPSPATTYSRYLGQQSQETAVGYPSPRPSSSSTFGHSPHGLYHHHQQQQHQQNTQLQQIAHNEYIQQSCHRPLGAVPTSRLVIPNPNGINLFTRRES